MAPESFTEEGLGGGDVTRSTELGKLAALVEANPLNP